MEAVCIRNNRLNVHGIHTKDAIIISGTCAAGNATIVEFLWGELNSFKHYMYLSNYTVHSNKYSIKSAGFIIIIIYY